MRAPVTTLGQLLVTVALVGLGGCSGGMDPEATLTAAAVAASNGQAGLVGAALPLPLRVEVASDGTPKEGVTVTWQTTAGSVAPTSSLTDVHGVAATSWTLGSVPGVMTLSATVAGAQGSPVSFNATALPLASTTAVAPTNDQTGVVGTALPLPLARTSTDRRAAGGRDRRILAGVLWEHRPRIDGDRCRRHGHRRVDPWHHRWSAERAGDDRGGARPAPSLRRDRTSRVGRGHRQGQRRWPDGGRQPSGVPQPDGGRGQRPVREPGRRGGRRVDGRARAGQPACRWMR